MAVVPAQRVRPVNAKEVRPGGRFVLYWMIAARRTHWNYALEHAVRRARDLDRPLVVLEPLRCGYRWASARFHRFVLDGMADNAKRFAGRDVRYYPYVEPEPGAGKGLLAKLASQACAVVTDDYPAFMLPRMIAAAARQVPVLLEAVDSNGIYPMRAAERTFPTAHSFRRHLQKELPRYLEDRPAADPLARLKLPRLERLDGVARRWPAAASSLLGGDASALARLPIDPSVAPAETRGGSVAGRSLLSRFVGRKLDRYHEDRNHPDETAASGLSPYLHFGHVSAHEVLWKLLDREDWTSDRLARKASGSREGWWGLCPPAEAFCDQIVTWRELGFNMCCTREDYEHYESLPDWARKTLAEHAGDPREYVYTLRQFESARTHDEIWNAAQRELVREGRMHNYLRMLWGKKILEWTATPQEALEIMVELNNKYALDGRDPNSYSGIFWVLGRYDRAWGPERPIFGKVRYMTSASTRRKLRLSHYLERYGEKDGPTGS